MRVSSYPDRHPGLGVWKHPLSYRSGVSVGNSVQGRLAPGERTRIIKHLVSRLQANPKGSARPVGFVRFSHISSTSTWKHGYFSAQE